MLRVNWHYLTWRANTTVNSSRHFDLSFFHWTRPGALEQKHKTKQKTLFLLTLSNIILKLLMVEVQSPGQKRCCLGLIKPSLVKLAPYKVFLGNIKVTSHRKFQQYFQNCQGFRLRSIYFLFYVKSLFSGVLVDFPSVDVMNFMFRNISYKNIFTLYS